MEISTSRKPFTLPDWTWHFCMLLLATAFIFAPTFVLAQTSPPIVQTFSNQTMGIHGRIFSVDLGNDGLIYASTLDENVIVAFDGANWCKIEIPTPSATVQAGKTGKIWLSQDNGIGFLQRDELGQYEYHPFDFEFSDEQVFPLWDSIRTANGVRFANNNSIYDLDETTDIIETSSTLAGENETFINWDSRIITKNTAESKFLYVDGEKRIPLDEFSAADRFEWVMPLPDGQLVYAGDGWTKLIVRHDEQWVSFSQEFDRMNNGSEFNWLMPMSGQRIGCGGKGGFYCFDLRGNVLFRFKPDEKLGSVTSWKEFSDKRIGLACENGIAVLTPTQDRQEWALYKYENIGTYGIQCDEGKIYIGTDPGFYEIDTEALSTTTVELPTPVHPAACMDLVVEDDGVLVGSSLGLLQWRQGELTTIVDGSITSVVRLDEEHLLATDVSGVTSIYRSNGNSFEKVRCFPTNQSQSRLFKQEHVLWQSEFIGRVSAVEFPRGFENEKTVVNWNSEVGFDYAWIHGYLGNDFVVVTSSGILVSNLKKAAVAKESVAAGTGQFDRPKTVAQLRPSKRYEQLTDTVRNNYVTTLIQCGENRLAMLGEECVTVHELVDGVFQARPIAQWELHPGGVVACWDDKHEIFWQVERGKLVAIDIDKFPQPKLASPRITAWSEDRQTEDVNVLANRGNIKLLFGVPLGVHHLDNVEYQHRLKGLKNKWTDWSKTSEIEYQGLPGGTYEFESRARTLFGETAISSLRFQVKRPWFLSWTAVATWFGLLGLTVYSATAWRSRRLIAANRKMEQLVAERTAEIEQKKIEIQRNAAMLDESERRSESDRLKSLDTLVSGIAHDFNNLLMVISANNEMIKLSQGGDAIDEFTDNSVVAIQSAADLCRELTDYSGSLPMELVSTSLNSIVSESRELIANTVRNGAKITYDLMDNGDATSILADVRNLKRALINLVINAVECCKQSIVIETSRDTLSDEMLANSRYVGDPPKPGEYCSLTVRDDGVGIQPEQMERLFDPFFSTKQLGRGLGLAIVMRVVGRLNGVIFVESTPDHGAQFRLCFPATPWRVNSKAPENKMKKTRCREGLRILLVDDEPLVLQSAEQILIASKHQVTSFSDPKDALKLIFENVADEPPFDCAVLDVAMQGMAGTDVAEILLDQYPEMPIVFVSGYNNSNLEIRLLESSRIAFLEKPFRGEQINQAIHDAISNGASTNRVG